MLLINNDNNKEIVERVKEEFIVWNLSVFLHVELGRIHLKFQDQGDDLILSDYTSDHSLNPRLHPGNTDIEILTVRNEGILNTNCKK